MQPHVWNPDWPCYTQSFDGSKLSSACQIEVRDASTWAEVRHDVPYCDITPLPEPGDAGLFAGLLLLVVLARRRYAHRSK